MKAVFFDVFSGASGDMLLGALLDLGVDFEALQRELSRLPVGEYHLHATRTTKSGISGTKLDVHLEADHAHTHEFEEAHGHRHAHPHDHHDHDAPAGPTPPSAASLANHDHDHPAHAPHRLPGAAPHAARDFREIAALIGQSSLSAWVRDRAVRVFRRIADAEGKIHGVPADQVHFHEVGAVDSIVDIVGVCLALEFLGCPQIFAAPLVEGQGWVQCAHGRFPVPAPATLEIVAGRGLTLAQCSEPHEMLTPTGAALLAEFAESFGAMPPMRLERVGYGLGTRNLVTRPNVLRAVLGDTTPSGALAGDSRDWETDQVALLETNLDDLNPEILGHFLELALASGALDAFYTPVQMKKSRPGVVLSLLCAANDADRFSELVLRETSAFGVRRTLWDRRKLRRELRPVETPFGTVTVKLGRLNGRVVQIAPEFDSCKAVAAAAGAPIKAIYEAARRGFGPGDDV